MTTLLYLMACLMSPSPLINLAESRVGNTVPNIDHYILPILGVIGLLALSPTIVRLLHSVVKQRYTRE